MLSRKGTQKVATSLLAFTQRRYDHDRWYGHALDLDVHSYKFTGEPPSWMKHKDREEDEIEFAKSIIPHMDFASCYEGVLWDADRMNPTLNRKEFGNEIKLRLEKQSMTVARAESILNEGKCKDQREEDIMIARIVDEEHVQAEMQYVKCIRANELAEDNRLDILPGGSPSSLREKTRWNVNTELHPLDRAEIASRLTAWLPEKYHIVYYDDFQTVAANDKTYRHQMMSVINNLEKEYSKEAGEKGCTDDLKNTISELRDDVDPTREITTEDIEKSNSLEQLEGWSRLIHEYNGDDRILEIYARASELSGNKDHVALVTEMKKWSTLAHKAPF